jgi:hypothetical protein
MQLAGYGIYDLRAKKESDREGQQYDPDGMTDQESQDLRQITTSRFRNGLVPLTLKG